MARGFTINHQTGSYYISSQYKTESDKVFARIGGGLFLRNTNQNGPLEDEALPDRLNWYL